MVSLFAHWTHVKLTEIVHITWLITEKKGERNDRHHPCHFKIKALAFDYAPNYLEMFLEP